MLRLLRPLALAAAAYFYFRVGFPQGGTTLYNAVLGPCLLGAAAGVHLLVRALSLEGRRALGLELAFAALVFLFVGLTYPLGGGSPPLARMLGGRRPTRADAALGLSKLGLDPHAAPARWALVAYP